MELATFSIGEHRFGIDVRVVQEVLRPQVVTKVPLAPGEIGGLINLRGQVVTALDLRYRFEMKPMEDKEPMVVVVSVAGDVAALLVDSIGDVVTVDEDLFEPPPETLPASYRELVLGAYKTDGRLLLSLDVPSAAFLEAA